MSMVLRIADDLNPLEWLRRRAMELAPDEGARLLPAPGLQVCRFGHATTFLKAATFGVTLGLVLQGKKRVRVAGGFEMTVQPPQLALMTRDAEYDNAVVNAAPDRPYLSLGLTFGADRVARALQALAEAGGSAAGDDVTALLLPYDRTLVEAVERLVKTLDEPLQARLLAPVISDEILYRLLCSDAAAAVRRGAGNPTEVARVVASMEHIRQRLGDKLTVAGLAKQAHMSPSHYAHRFAAVARTTPMRYLRELRLERARGLLEAGARVGEVALDVGYASPAHFTRDYKRRFGVSPSKTIVKGD